MEPLNWHAFSGASEQHRQMSKVGFVYVCHEFITLILCVYSACSHVWVKISEISHQLFAFSFGIAVLISKHREKRWKGLTVNMLIGCFAVL